MFCKFFFCKRYLKNCLISYAFFPFSRRQRVPDSESKYGGGIYLCMIRFFFKINYDHVGFQLSISHYKIHKQLTQKMMSTILRN